MYGISADEISTSTSQKDTLTIALLKYQSFVTESSVGVGQQFSVGRSKPGRRAAAAAANAAVTATSTDPAGHCTGNITYLLTLYTKGIHLYCNIQHSHHSAAFRVFPQYTLNFSLLILNAAAEVLDFSTHRLISRYFCSIITFTSSINFRNFNLSSISKF